MMENNRKKGTNTFSAFFLFKNYLQHYQSVTNILEKYLS